MRINIGSKESRYLRKIEDFLGLDQDNSWSKGPWALRIEQGGKRFLASWYKYVWTWAEGSEEREERQENWRRLASMHPEELKGLGLSLDSPEKLEGIQNILFSIVMEEGVIEKEVEDSESEEGATIDEPINSVVITIMTSDTDFWIFTDADCLSEREPMGRITLYNFRDPKEGDYVRLFTILANLTPSPEKEVNLLEVNFLPGGMDVGVMLGDE